jgi:hypothetical protein
MPVYAEDIWLLMSQGKRVGCSAGKRTWQSIWTCLICLTLFDTATTHFQDWYVLVASHNLTYPITHLFE